MSTLQERLQEAFTESDYRSWAAVSRAANLNSGSTIYDLLKGRTGAESPSLVRLAYVLGVNAMWLQYDRGPKSAKRGLALADSDAQEAVLPMRSVQQDVSRQTLREIGELFEIYAGASDVIRARIMRAARAAERDGQSALPIANDQTVDGNRDRVR